MDIDTTEAQIQQKEGVALWNVKLSSLLPGVILLAALISFLFVDAALPLYGLGFTSALLPSSAQRWSLLPTLFLFPHWRLAASISGLPNTQPPIATSWYEAALLLLAFSALLSVYLVALRALPGIISWRYLLLSTTLLGAICVCITMVTSDDIFSYIFYARVGVIYHLNPVTTVPLQIPHDPTYANIYWRDQPSAYGPTWIIISCALQWFTALFDKANITFMVLALRLLGLLSHLCSVLLVWSIGGYLQRSGQTLSAQRRMLATLAFAWNPLLLFEACTNAHNDTVLLLLLLFSLWILVRIPIFDGRTALFVAIILALATCLKVNIALLFPGYILFLWAQERRIQTIALALVGYGATVIALYVPFWGNGAILNLVHVNPGTHRNINTVVEFITRVINSGVTLLGGPQPQEIGSPAENILHTSCLIVFLLLYALLCLRVLMLRRGLQTPLQLVRWMTYAWFLYCAIGSPWFWPWYLVTFFGLFALLEAVDADSNWRIGRRSMLRAGYLPLFTRFLAFSMLSGYCFYPWGLYASTIPWLPAFRWAYLRGLWSWGLPFLLLFFYRGIRATYSSLPLKFQRRGQDE